MIDVLVTGGAGFIGSNFVRHALAAHGDWRVTTLDKLTYAGRLENLHEFMDHPRDAFVRGDVCDAAVVRPLVARSAIVVRRDQPRYAPSAAAIASCSSSSVISGCSATVSPVVGSVTA